MNPTSHVFYQPGNPYVIDFAEKHPEKGFVSLLRGQTHDEMKLQYPGVEVTDTESWRRIEEDMFRVAPVEISEERYIDRLEVLPPVGFVRNGSTESFKMSERITGAITTICVRIGSRYFEMKDNINLTHAQLVEKCADA